MGLRLAGISTQGHHQHRRSQCLHLAVCRLQLGRVTSERVLANLRESLPSRRPQLLAECRSLGRCSLAAAQGDSGGVRSGDGVGGLRGVGGFGICRPLLPLSGWGESRGPMELTAVLSPAEEGGYVAYNPETGTASQGETIDEALANLREATSLYLEEFPAGLKGHPLVTMFSLTAHA